MNLSAPAVTPEEQLWQQACEGDRDAFTKIVERHQTLICSLAYSACGTLGASEDMAQETFITAWHRLKELRGGVPESLENVAEVPSPENDPAAHAVTREEEALLWRTLAELPANYREPLVLFYREQQSVAEVARQLDLTEDTVKQRLSRGRNMLRTEMTALVESALTRAKPGRAFTVAVLAALPMASATTASAVLAAGTVATSSGTVGKGILAKLGLGVLAGPLIGLVSACLGTRAVASTARSKPERDVLLRHSRWIIAFCFAMSIGLAVVLSLAGKLYTPSAWAIVIGIGVWTVGLVGTILVICNRLDREVKRLRMETNTGDTEYADELSINRLKRKFFRRLS